MGSAPALVLFDIDGTLIRRAGGHHREALVKAISRVAGLSTSLDTIDTSGRLDCDLIREMMQREGVPERDINRTLPHIMKAAQNGYARTCPDLRRKTCPGVRSLLYKLHRRRIPKGLVTGNLSRIAWCKMRRAGIDGYFQFGAFAEMADARNKLVKAALQHARRARWIHRDTRISLIGDHPNDVEAAKLNGIQSIGVATGVCGKEALAASKPDILVADLRFLTLDLLL